MPGLPKIRAIASPGDVIRKQKYNALRTFDDKNGPGVCVNGRCWLVILYAIDGRSWPGLACRDPMRNISPPTAVLRKPVVRGPKDRSRLDSRPSAKESAIGKTRPQGTDRECPLTGSSY